MKLRSRNNPTAVLESPQGDENLVYKVAVAPASFVQTNAAAPRPGTPLNSTTMQTALSLRLESSKETDLDSKR